MAEVVCLLVIRQFELSLGTLGFNGDFVTALFVAAQDCKDFAVLLRDDVNLLFDVVLLHKRNTLLVLSEQVGGVVVVIRDGGVGSVKQQLLTVKYYFLTRIFSQDLAIYRGLVAIFGLNIN